MREGKPSREQLVENHSRGPEVGLFRPLSVKDLRRHVTGRAGYTAGMRTRLEHSGQTEVCQTWCLFLQQDVCWLQISVDDLLCMEVIKTGYYSARHCYSRFDRWSRTAMLFQPLFQRAVGSVLADYYHLAVIDISLDYRQHIRMSARLSP